MPISDWNNLLVQTITHRPVASKNVYGQPQYSGTATSYRARVVEKPRRVTSRITGEDVIASTRVWVGGVIPELSIHDEITLPDGTQPLLHSWDLFPDEAGNHHMVLNVSRKARSS